MVVYMLHNNLSVEFLVIAISPFLLLTPLVNGEKNNAAMGLSKKVFLNYQGGLG